jgi:hypothetical protein
MTAQQIGAESSQRFATRPRFRVRAPFAGRCLFHAGDLHSPFGHTSGGGASLNRGSHSYPQRSQRYAVTSFLKIAMQTTQYHDR